MMKYGFRFGSCWHLMITDDQHLVVSIPADDMIVADVIIKIELIHL